MNSNKVSVSQNKQASAIHYFKLAVDTLFLRMENNLADPKEDFHFNDEEHIIEKAEQIDILYENLFVSDEKKSELRQYILKEADIFNSKYREVYGDVYMDNYLNFVDCRDYDVFEAEKKENADQYKVIKPKVVDESDSESESDDDSDDEENPPMCYRCNSLILDNVGFHYDEKTDVYIHGDCKDDDSESESESESGDEQIEDDIYHVRGQIEEMKCRSRYDFPISGYGIDAKLIKIWRAIHISEAHKQAKDLAIKKEQDKLNKLIEANKQYKIKKSKEVTVDDSESESDNESQVSMFSQTQSESENKEETMQIINFRQWKTESDEATIKALKEKNKDFFSKIVEAEKENVSKDDQIKNLKAVIDDLRNQKDEHLEQIRQSKEDFDKMYNRKNELEDKTTTFELKIKALEYQNTEKHQQWQYENMKKDRQHFIDLNNERWKELEKMKKDLKKSEEENEKLKNDASNDDLTIENKDHFNNDIHCCLACAINVKIADLKRIQKEYTSKVKKGLYC